LLLRSQELLKLIINSCSLDWRWHWFWLFGLLLSWSFLADEAEINGLLQLCDCFSLFLDNGSLSWVPLFTLLWGLSCSHGRWS
jgi:hypothetical protein